MTDDNRFEPQLGPIGRRAGRPATQLKSLARLSRWGKPSTVGRRKLPGGTVAKYGRGKGAAAVARNWAEQNRRRALVNVTIAPSRGGSTAAFSSHIDYIRRDHTEAPGSRGQVFDRDGSGLSADAFKRRSADDNHQFRITISPEDSGEIKDLTDFTRRLMKQVERDLRTETDWIAVVHHNSAHPHIHIVVRGRNEQDGILIIDRKYLSYGLRHRAEELITRELGQPSWRDRYAARLREASAERLTSIDWELDRESEGGRIMLRPIRTFQSAHGWSTKVARLQTLQRLGIARHVYGGEWHLADRWTETLKALGERTAVISRMNEELSRYGSGPGVVQEAAPAAGTWITGRLISRIERPMPGGRETILIDGVDGRLWVWRATGQEAGQLPAKGAIISVEIPASHPRSPTGPTGNGARAMEPAPDRIRLFVHSWVPLEALIERRALNWLDEIGETSLANHGSGFGAAVREARAARQMYLLRAPIDHEESEQLHSMERLAAAEALARRLGRHHAQLEAREVFSGDYLENVQTAHGPYAVIANRSRFVLVPATDDIAGLLGKPVTIEPDIGRVLDAAMPGWGTTRA